MSFEWLTGSEKQFSQGKPGLCVILVDVSGSMEDHLTSLDEALRSAISTFPNARVFKFAMDVEEMTLGSNPQIRGCTNLNVALQKASNLKPAKTVVISDGVPDDANAALATADRMPGSIDALWTTIAGRSDTYEARRFMQTLARRGRGTMRQASIRDRGALYAAMETSIRMAQKVYTDYGIRDANAMSQTKHFPKGNVHIEGPGVRTEYVYEDIRIVRQRRFHYEDAEDQHIDNSAPRDAHIQIAGSDVHYRAAEAIEHHHEAPRGLLKTLFLGPARQQYRGEIKAAPQQHAIANRSEQPMQQIAYFSKEKVRG